MFASRKAGNPVEFVFNNMFIHCGYSAVIAKSKNKEAGMKLLAYYLNPEAQARWANLYGLMGTQRDCVKYMNEDAKKRLLNFDDPNSCLENVDWWGPRQAEILKRYKEFLLT